MPELPEVETILREIKPKIIGRTIVATKIHNNKLRYPITQEIIDLKNKQILNVQRRAKYLLLKLNIGWIIIHFGMTGSIQIFKRSQIINKHDHLDLIMDNDNIIRYNDPRRFGSCWWSFDAYKDNRLINLGIEPLSDAFNSHWLYETSRNKRTQIKPWLMNPNYVAGIGNIYSSESLFVAGISPYRTVNLLSYVDASRLVTSIKTVLLLAINHGGTTIYNFIRPNGKLGDFHRQLKVYNRKGYSCFNCKTIIESFQQNQRTTFFCPYCQL